MNLIAFIIRPITITKRIQRFERAPFSELVRLLARIGCPVGKAKQNVCQEIGNNCNVSSHPRPLASAQKLSLPLACQAFNEKIEADFIYLVICKTKYCFLHVVDNDARYSKSFTFNERYTERMINLLKVIWFLRHGAFKEISADVEFTKSKMLSFPLMQSILFHDYSVRKDNKNGVI